MSEKEICKKVRELCSEAGLDFLFILPNASEWSATTESVDHLRRMVVIHEKQIEDSNS